MIKFDFVFQCSSYYKDYVFHYFFFHAQIFGFQMGTPLFYAKYLSVNFSGISHCNVVKIRTNTFEVIQI